MSPRRFARPGGPVRLRLVVGQRQVIQRNESRAGDPAHRGEQGGGLIGAEARQRTGARLVRVAHDETNAEHVAQRAGLDGVPGSQGHGDERGECRTDHYGQHQPADRPEAAYVARRVGAPA